jgi:hypothetical protein
MLYPRYSVYVPCCFLFFDKGTYIHTAVSKHIGRAVHIVKIDLRKRVVQKARKIVRFHYFVFPKDVFDLARNKIFNIKINLKSNIFATNFTTNFSTFFATICTTIFLTFSLHTTPGKKKSLLHTRIKI